MAVYVSFAKRLFLEDRIIKIYVGPNSAESKPFYVQQAVLESASDYFSKALDPNKFREGHEGVLHFPEDHRWDWIVFLYWLYHGKLSHMVDKDELIYVRCWCMGNKYGVPGFQDHIMWCLLNYYDKVPADLAAIREAFMNSPPHSKLRRLMAEEAVSQHRKGEISNQEFNELDGTAFMGEFLTTLENYKVRTARVKEGAPVKKPIAELWEKYMVEKVSTVPFDCEKIV